ncbi:MAG: hypothetical protein ACFB21_16815 [Opitutales bacterium]
MNSHTVPGLLPGRNLLTGFAALVFANLAGGTPAHRPDWPFNSETSVPYNESSITGWAATMASVSFGSAVGPPWMDTSQALGPASPQVDDIVSLGRGGSITLELPVGLEDGPGWDLAVFENSFSARFLELAYVEVSHDGVTFVRFPNYSYTPDNDPGSSTPPVPAFGEINPENIWGYAGKFRAGEGTPFDLAHLESAYQAVLSGSHQFSTSYRLHLQQNYPQLQGKPVRFVRIVDIVGDGSARDSEGFEIYDPTPTAISAGFDLDGVAYRAASMAPASSQIAWSEIINQPLSRGSLPLQANIATGQPITFSIVSGPATIVDKRLNWTGAGEITVRASAPALPGEAPPDSVTQVFQVATAIQRLYASPLPNQLSTTDTVPFSVTSSAGLPVTIQVFRGPAAYNEASGMLEFDGSTGTVMVEARQEGNATTAAAEPLRLTFDIVNPGSPAAPVGWPAYASARGLPVVAEGNDADGDGAADGLEYFAGTDPTNASDAPRPAWKLTSEATGVTAFRVSLPFDPTAADAAVVWETAPTPAGPWSTAVPRVLDEEAETLTVELPVTTQAPFARARIE